MLLFVYLGCNIYLYIKINYLMNNRGIYENN